jgi:hypothetical protein
VFGGIRRRNTSGPLGHLFGTTFGAPHPAQSQWRDDPSASPKPARVDALRSWMPLVIWVPWLCPMRENVNAASFASEPSGHLGANKPRTTGMALGERRRDVSRASDGSLGPVYERGQSRRRRWRSAFGFTANV